MEELKTSFTDSFYHNDDKKRLKSADFEDLLSPAIMAESGMTYIGGDVNEQSNLACCHFCPAHTMKFNESTFTLSDGTLFPAGVIELNESTKLGDGHEKLYNQKPCIKIREEKAKNITLTSQSEIIVPDNSGASIADTSHECLEDGKKSKVDHTKTECFKGVDVLGNSFALTVPGVETNSGTKYCTSGTILTHKDYPLPTIELKELCKFVSTVQQENVLVLEEEYTRMCQFLGNNTAYVIRSSWRELIARFKEQKDKFTGQIDSYINNITDDKDKKQAELLLSYLCGLYDVEIKDNLDAVIGVVCNGIRPNISAVDIETSNTFIKKQMAIRELTTKYPENWLVNEELSGLMKRFMPVDDEIKKTKSCFMSTLLEIQSEVHEKIKAHNVIPVLLEKLSS